MPDSKRRRSLLLCLALAGTALLIPAACGGADQSRLESETIIVEDEPGEDDEVEFLFPSGTHPAEGERRVREIAEELALRIRSIDQDPEPEVRGALEIELDTILGRRTGFLERELDGDVLRRLDIFGRGRIVLDLYPGAEVTSGGAEPLGGDLFMSRFALAAPADVRHRVPFTELVLPLLLLVALVGVPYPALRAYAHSVERQAIDVSEKVHRLRLASAAVWLAVVVAFPLAFLTRLVLLPYLVVAEAAPSLTRWGGTPVVGIGAVLLLLVLVPLAALLLTVQPMYRALRGIEKAPRQRARKLAWGLLFLVPSVLWIVALELLPAVVTSNPSLHATAVVLLAVLFVGLVWPFTIVRALDTYRLGSPVRERLLELCRRQRLRVRDVRAIRGRHEKAANAAIVGPFPPFRYVLVTDHLLDTFEDDEVEAVVAHEIGHGKQHHLLLKMAASFVSVLAVWVLFAGVLELFGAADPLSVAVFFPVALVLAFVLVQGTLGLLLERKADEYAARTVGAGPMVRALEKLAAINQLKKRTGLVWNLLQQHPAVEQRIQALERRGAQGRTK